MTESEFHPARRGETVDFGTRGVAFMIDGVFLACLAGCTFFILAGMAVEFMQAGRQNFLVLLGLAVLSALALPALLATFYFIVLHSHGGQTLGKVFMGIKVVSDSGENLSAGASFLRLVGYLLSAVPLGAGFLWSVVDKDCSAWHDRLACSRVIYV
ncbi:MAG: RDD family protein [Deltaproteobacteria bacterium]|nr:RDD family protein [Deltaproteobacteria bacterium]